jgi:hypothetical protein
MTIVKVRPPGFYCFVKFAVGVMKRRTLRMVVSTGSTTAVNQRTLRMVVSTGSTK